MTARDLIELAGRQPLLLAALVIAPPMCVVLLGWIHGPGRGGVSPWKYVYAVLVYLVSVPGVGAAVLSAYTLFFTRESFLDVNLFVYLAPIVSMGVTLGVVRRSVSFDEVPGFHRLSGLMALIAVTFVIVLAIRKTFIGIFFGASLATLFVLGAGLFGLLTWGASALFRGRNEPKTRPPAFPSV